MTEDAPRLPPRGEPALAATRNFSIDVYWGIADMQRFATLMNEIKSLVAPGFFLGDSLFTRGRNNSALEDLVIKR
jgi:O-methyltransferase